MAWPGLYNLLHGFLFGPGILGRTASGTGPAALLSGADVVTLLPDATSSADGKMTAAYASKLDGISAGADATGFRGNVTTSQRNSLENLQAGHWIRNTDWPYGQNLETYSGALWVRERCVIKQWRGTENSVAGHVVIPSGTYDNAVALTTTSGDMRAYGILLTDGVSAGGNVVVAPIGCCLDVEIYIYAYGSTTRGEFFFSHTTAGFCRSNTAGAGGFGRVLSDFAAQAGGGKTIGNLSANAEIY